MPKAKQARSPKPAHYRPFLVLTDNRTTLQLLIMAFLALSALLVLQFTTQKEELETYKQAVLSSSSVSK